MFRDVCSRRSALRSLALLVVAFCASAVVSLGQTYYWTPVFKLRNNQTAQITAADFPGPGGTNGLVYPNWYYAGIAGGIPAQHPRYGNVLNLSSYAGYDNTGATDQWAVIMRGIEDLNAQGGGVLQLGAGTFLLRDSLIITYDNIVIRGAGRELTKIDYRPGIVNGSGQLVKGIKWLYLKDGDTVPLDYLIQVRAPQTSDRWINDAAFNYIRIYVNGVQRASTGTDRQGGPNLVTLRASDANSGITAGQTVALYGEVDYGGGEIYRTPTINVTFTDPLPYGKKRLTPAYAAFSFAGDEWSRRGVDHTFNLTANAARGATSVQVDTSTPTLAANFALIKPGDLIRIEKPNHGSSFLTERATNANTGTRYLLTVLSTSGGNTINFAEPLREAFPTAHSSRVKSETMPIRNVGVEDLWIDQSAQQMWTSGVHFIHAHQSWVKNVKVTKIGRFPIWPSNSKNIEIRDVVLDEAWYRLGGGTAYIGFGESNDNLIDGVQGARLRHGPNYGNFANGNVVRNGVFDAMDAHVGHNSWVVENLVELSTLDARQPEDLPAGFGTSYGHAVTAETRDGPQGPRNTFYNNILKTDPRTSFDRSGLDTSGGMEAFYFIANKIFSVGPTVLGGRRDIDLVFEDNVLIIERATAGVAYMPQENAGWEFRNNTIYGGSGQMLAAGSTGTLGVNTGNTFLPFDANWDTSIADPAPTVPSLYQWQLDTKYTAVPATPTGVTATAGNRSFTVQWNASTNAAAYIVRWGTSAGNYTFSSSGHVARTATISNVNNGQLYYVTVAAVNHRGVSGNATAVTVTPAQGGVPNTPTGLGATAVGTSQINLAWTDAASNETAYIIERRNGEFGPWATIATLGANVTSYNNTGLLPNQQLHYRVTARNATGDSLASNVAVATTANAAPNAVTIFALTPTSGQVLLTWSHVYNATGYTIQRATAAGGPFTNLQTNFTGDRYTDTAVTNGTTYYYRLIATNAAGSSAPSSVLSAVPNGAPSITLTSPEPGFTVTGPVTLNLAATATDADGTVTQVQFFNGTTLLATDTSAPYTYTWNNVAAGTYHIRAIATDNIGATSETSRYVQVVNPNTAAATPLITEPFNYTAGVGPATPGVTLDGGTGLRGAWGGGSATLVGAGSLSYLDTAGQRTISSSGNRFTSDASEWVTGRSTQRDPNDASNPLFPWFNGTAGVIGKAGTVFWMSYLVRFDGAPSIAALRVSGGSSGTELFFGPYTLTAGQFAIQNGQNPGSPVASTGVTPQLGQTYLVVVKFEFNGGGRDAVRMWVNPRTDGAVPSGGASATMAVSGLDASFQSFSFRGNPAYSVDELRGGGAFRDVVPGTATNVPPTISILTPERAATLASPASVAITTDAGGSITQVQFYNGTTLLGTDTTAPYSFTWNSAPVGWHTIRAVASGPLGTAEDTRRVQIVDPATPAGAVVIYDGFDYPAGTDGTNMIGQGLRTAWGGTPDITEAGSGGLTYYDPLSGLQLQQVGNRLISSASNWVSGAFTNRDSVGSPLQPWFTATNGVIGKDDTSIWVSYLLRFDSAPGTAALRLHNPGAELFFGVYTASTGAELGIQNGQTNATFTGTGLAAQTGQTYLIVLKYEFGVGDTDLVRMWVNPRLDRVVPESAYTAVVHTNLDASWQQLSFRGSSNYSVDEFRAGAAFRDVIPSVNVGAPPTVTLTSPTAGALLAAPGSITLSATTTNTVTRVEFYNGTTLLGQDTTAPYTYQWNNIAAGEYTVRAVVVGPAGTAESSGRLTVLNPNATPQPAVLHESFDYAAGTLGTAMSGGTALRNAWGGSANAVAAAGSLSYVDAAANLQLVTSANRFTSAAGEWSSGKSTQNSPNDATNPLFPWFSGAGLIGKDNTSFWVSFLLRFDATPGWAGLRLHNSGPNELFFGAYSLSGGQLGIQNGQSAGSPFVSTGLAAQANTTYLIVLHFQFGDAGNDAVRMWVNPSLNQGVPTSANSALMSGLDLTWQNLALRGSVAYSVDEIRGGASFRDVIPSTAAGGGNTPPSITQAAAAAPSNVTGTTTALSVRATDNGGEPALTYTWAATSVPGGAATPTFSANGTNAAKDTTATFFAPGAYTFQATVSDGSLSTTSSVNVTVTSTASGISVSPATAALNLGGTQQFSATVVNQFGTPVSASVAWSRTGSAGGSISAGGLYTASSTTTGTDTVTGTSGALSDSSTVTVTNATPVAQNDTATTTTGTAVNINVLANDSDPDNGPSDLTISNVGTAANGTTAIVSGQVRYTPNAGFTGTNTFNYTITDGSATATATVTVTVSATPPPTGAIVYEGFNYTAGTLGSAMTTGTHLRTDSNWGNGANTLAAANSLAYTDPTSGAQLQTSANRLTSSAWEWAGARLVVRDPNTSANPLFPWLQGYGVVGAENTTFWVSFLLRFDATPGAAAMRTTSGGAAELFFGSYTSASGGALGIQVGQTGGTFTSAGLNAVQGTTYLIVVRYQFGANDSDTVTMWVNPTLGGATPMSAYTATVSGVNAAFNGFTFRGGVAYSADEVRAGGTFADVTPVSNPPAPLTIAGATASSSENGNPPGNTLDGNFTTRWATQGIQEYITYDLGGSATVSSVDLAWYNGNSRVYTFDVLVGDGANTWTKVLDQATSSGTTAGLENYVFAPATGTHLRIVNWGNSSTLPNWISIYETVISGVRPSGGGGNQAPVAVNDTGTTDEDVAVTINVLANDSDPDNGPSPLSVSSVGLSSYGSTAIISNEVRYTPDTGFFGTDSFSYTITDGAATATANVTVTVNEVASSTDLSSLGLTRHLIGGATGTSRIMENGYAEITGTGIGLATGGDQLVIETQPTTGDFTVTVRVRLQTALSGLQPLAGVIIRDGLASGGRVALIGIHPDGTLRWQNRVTTTIGGSTVSLGTTDVWLRVSRVGTRLYTFSSLNGTTWTQRSNNNMTTLSTSLQAGLFIFSGNGSTSGLARFSDFSKTSP